MARRYWLCSCGARNPRTASRRCPSCGDLTKPKARVMKHAKSLRDLPYPEWVKVHERIHGITDESCGVCGKPRTQERHHDRDHDHVTKLPRGLACGGNQGCNLMMPKWMTAGVAAAISAQMLSEGQLELAARYRAISEYLARVDAYYAQQAAA